MPFIIMQESKDPTYYLPPVMFIWHGHFLFFSLVTVAFFTLLFSPPFILAPCCSAARQHHNTSHQPAGSQSCRVCERRSHRRRQYSSGTASCVLSCAAYTLGSNRSKPWNDLIVSSLPWNHALAQYVSPLAVRDRKGKWLILGAEAGPVPSSRCCKNECRQ